MSESEIESLSARLEAAELRALTAERDRDWWMAQHDAVMRDWHDDLARMGQSASADFSPITPPSPDPASEPLRSALAALLVFFDARTGSVTFRIDNETLPDAFVRAIAAVRVAREEVGPRAS